MNRIRRLACALIALLIAVPATAGLASVARTAVVTIQPGAAGSIVGLSAARPSPAIPPGATGSIVVTKLAAGSEPQKADGLPIVLPDEHVPVTGARFDVHAALAADGTMPDLRTESGWAALEAMPKHSPRLGALAGTGTTGADGVARFDGLAVGAYWVVEEKRPGQPVAAPFLVTLPMTHPVDLDRWLYEVYAYPKDGTHLSIVLDEGDARVAGDHITWHIRAGIPHEDVDDMAIFSELDDRVSHHSHVVSIEHGTSTDAGQTNRASARDALLAERRHYVVTHTGQTVGFGLTEEGRALVNQNGGAELAIALNATIDASLETDGTTHEVPGNARLHVLGAELAAQALPSKWARVDAHVTEKCSAQPMADGAFHLYRTEADARADRERVQLGGVDTFPVDAEGRLRIGALNASNWKDGHPLPDGEWQAFFAVEARTPTVLADGRRVPVAAQGGPIGVYSLDASAGVDQRIVYEDVRGCAPPGPRPIPAPTGADVAGLLGAVIALLALGWLLAATRRGTGARNE